jgi:hypothetical protein
MASHVESFKSTFITFHTCVDVVNEKHAAFCGISDVGSFNLVHSGVRGAQGFQLCFTLRWSRLLNLHQCFGPKVVRQRVTAAPLQFTTLLTHLGDSVNAPPSVLKPALPGIRLEVAVHTNCRYRLSADALRGPSMNTTAYALTRAGDNAASHRSIVFEIEL